MGLSPIEGFFKSTIELAVRKTSSFSVELNCPEKLMV